MKIGIDIDEVIAEYLKHFLKFVHKKTGKKFEYNSIFDYNFCKPLGMSFEEVSDLIEAHTCNTNALLELDLIEDAVESINSLSDHEIFFITSRHLNNFHKTKEFLERNFPELKFDLIFSGDAWKNLNKSKKEICLENGISLMIEDNPNYVLDCSKAGINSILFDKPWNKNLDEKGYKNIFRVKNWKEAKKVIQEIGGVK